MSGKNQESDASVKVICRFRPINENEQTISSRIVCEFPDPKTVLINTADNSTPQRFDFDQVFSPDSAQVDVFEIAGIPIVNSVMKGFNGTVFAYGQTSSGKTYTMTGPDVDDEVLCGMIPRMVRAIFEFIAGCETHIEFTVKVGYAEIYLEKIKDLIDPSRVNLMIKEDRQKGVFIQDLTEEYVSSLEEVFELMKIGTQNREVGFTNMNAGSSRSHSIFIMTISQSNSMDYSAKNGKLYLVDLAGSEKVGKTGAEGQRLEEAKNINKSLSCLGKVIYALTDGKSTHVPYRDSKLTRVLQDSLGGNSKTSLIITCSPSSYNEQETLSTLRFGMRAKTIKNKPKINREYTVQELKLMLAKAREQIVEKDSIIERLKKGIVDQGGQLPMEMSPQRSHEAESLEEELRHIKDRLYEEEDRSSALQEQINALFQENRAFTDENAYLTEENSQLKYTAVEMEALMRQLDEKLEEFTYREQAFQQEISRIHTEHLNTEQQLQIANQQITELESKRPKEHDEEKSQLKASLKIAEERIEELQEQLKTRESISPGGVQEANQQDLQSIQKIAYNQGMADEREKYISEKENLLRSLQSTVDKQSHLYLLLDEAQDYAQTLENSLTLDQREMKRRIDFLEKNLETMNMVHQKQTVKISQMKMKKDVLKQKIKKMAVQMQEKDDVLDLTRQEFDIISSKFVDAVTELESYKSPRIPGIPRIKRPVVRGRKTEMPQLDCQYVRLKIFIIKMGKIIG